MEVTMEDGMKALLEKSRLLSHREHSFFVEAKPVSPKGFSFWLPNCFYHSDLDSDNERINQFERILRAFFRRYFETWLRQIKKGSNEEKTMTENPLAIADFFLKMDAEDIFKKLESMITVRVEEPLSGAIFSFKRFGDVLAFNIYRTQRSSDEEHTTGREAVLTLCRRKDPGNNQGIYELIQRVESAIAIPEENFSNSGNSTKCDLRSFGEMISKALYYAEINFSPEKIIEAYQKIGRDVLIGKCHGLDIGCRLVHKNADKKDNIASEDFQYIDRARTWRRGNVSQVSDVEYVFQEGELVLIISVNSSLPRSTFDGKNSQGEEYHNEQFLLAQAGSMVATSLASMMFDSYLKIHLKLNPVKRRK